MNRSLVAIILAAACSSCALEAAPPDPDLWALALVAPSNIPQADVYLGGHHSLDACKDAGVDWLAQRSNKAYLLQCRLNCRKMAKDDPATCEAIEPVG